MWIVRVALQRPYTFIMLAVLIVFLGVYSILKTPTDIFPDIKIPIAAVIWRYTGLLPEEMANRIVLFSERTAQTVVNDVEHTESQSVNSEAVVKYFFQPEADQDLSLAQIIAVSQTQLQSAPPGTTPPFVLSYNASSVPISAAGAVERDHSRAGDLRPRQQHPAHPARHRRRRLHPVSLRRQAAPGAGRSRSPAAAGARPGGLRRGERHQLPEPDPAGGHREDRLQGVLRQAECEPDSSSMS